MKLDSECMRNIALLESLTGAGARDCIVDDESGTTVFVVNEGEMGLAIGRNGKNIRKVERNLGSSVELVEYSEDPETFVRNALKPAEVSSVTLEEAGDGLLARVDVEDEHRGVAIGKEGKNIDKAKALGERHHKVKDVVLE
ncbi:MAG: hypothetical protein MAG715_00126 [Methanonatronarchaeales archaeon]|nr:hypothetical protein [Methanonatronarchaeales archaeon]